jgi:hypothetical protein
MTPPSTQPDAADVAARLDRLPVTVLHVAIVVLCALGLLFDVAKFREAAGR